MAKTMPAVVQYEMRPGAVDCREMPLPGDPGEGEVLLRIRGVGVCGSDVHQYHNTQSWSVRVPVILGHEFCGTVAALGKGVRGFSEGELVACETAAEIDPDSPLSRQGMYNLDPARRGFGYDIHGAMAEYVKVPARLLHHVPKNVPAELAAMTEPCCVAYQCTVVNTRIRPGDLVVVIGPGPIGLLCATMARLSGAGRVVLAGISRDKGRMETGLKAGATHAVDVQKDDMKKVLADLGDGLGADVVIDSTGASVSLQSAIDWVRPAGHVTKVGWGPQPMNFSMDPLVKKAVTLQGSFSHTWAVWERVLRMMGTGQLDPRPYLSKVAKLSDWKDCFDGMHEGGYIKAVLTP
jgi:alcohol dehydrogenase/L-iditol 2-dehydrogenase